MAENEQSQEKTEEPTQRRLEAREDGEVLSSRDDGFCIAATSLLIIAALGFSRRIYWTLGVAVHFWSSR